MSNKVIVPLRPGSDGDATHRPTLPGFTEVVPPTTYLEKIGQQWMDSRGQAVAGKKYILERLPPGYALFERARKSEPSHVDKFLYGHPDRKPFDSANRFYPHFEYLMNNGGDSMGCPCTVCNAKGGILPPMGRKKTGSITSHSSPASAAPAALTAPTAPTASKGPTAPQGHTRPNFAAAAQIKGRPKVTEPGMDSSRVDDEGTPDVYRNLIDKLKRYRTFDEAIKEPMSLDWRAEQELLPGLLAKLKADPQCFPRAGEIVLYVRHLPNGVDICREESNDGYRLYDRKSKTFLGIPAWEAGLVGQTPCETTELDDLVQEQGKEMNVAYSGVRVEPLPDPNSSDKSLSKRYTYVPLHQTRPFIFWEDYLGSIPKMDWHPTINNALTAMSTVAVMGKHRFKGTWPEAQIYCHGIYIGSEMFTVGDVVRLLPKANEPGCSDILVIRSIRVKLTYLDLASSNDYDEGRPYNSSIFVIGKGYTKEATRSSKEWISADADEEPLWEKFSKHTVWHPLQPPEKELQIPFSRILGRFFEAEAMALWFPSSNPVPDPNLSAGLVGIRKARNIARMTDQRITLAFDTTWFWGDTRAEALDLQTVNGLEVGKHDKERDPHSWRKKIKAMENSAAGDKTAVSGMRNLRGFMASGSGSGPGSGPETSTSGTNTGTGTGTGSKSGTSLSRKRSKVISISSGEEEEEEEIRKHTKIIEPSSATERKKNNPTIRIATHS
ncbi:hypothetical protein BDV95DRAFT_499750 [Massariosphaeria phaeospora]|uniref:Transcription-silencing protein Clr2-domain-containing protein n=1 Tax=Massariosphaeria phaeospora TaxID=100035 RepID=A0A7C8MB69_9PLEO|nr:hypothetical protein BDV95DRAFT_499750 [Massariosphaeria phaeospora]